MSPERPLFRSTSMQVTCALLLALPLLALPLLVGCDPSRFMLTGKNPIQCRIYGPVNSVEHTPDITVLEPDGVLGLSVAQLTEFRFVMNTTLLEGEGMSIMLRPIAQESVVDSGIVFHFSKSHSYIDSAGHLLLDLPQVHMRIQGNELITVLSENHELELTIGCDTILKRMTSMMETDDIVLKADPTSKVRITGADWQEIPNSDEKSVTHLTME